MTPVVVTAGPPLVVSGVTPVVLDPAEVAEDRTEVAINSGAIVIATDGLDWGDAQIEAYMADLSVGSAPVDYRLPNRQITIPLILGADGPDDFELARSNLTAKVALFQRKGGWLKRGEGFYADIVNATLKLPDRYGHLGVESDVVLTLEALPDFYTDEVEYPAASETTARELITMLGGAAGNHPGRVRIVVEEQDGESQLGLIWALRSHHYSAAATAACAFAAQDLTALDAAANATVDGVAAVRHQALAANWTPILSTDIAALGAMTHTGTNQIWALCHTTSTTRPRLRFVYDVGDIVFPEENDSVEIPGTSGWYWVNLGEARLDVPPVGTHRWQGNIQAKGAIGGENVSIARLYVLNVEDGYGVLRASRNTAPGLADYEARDEFNQTVSGGSDPLTGLTAPVGGVWAGAGDTDDFEVEDTGHTAQRSTVSDTGSRFALAGTATPSNIVSQVDLKASRQGVVNHGVFARYTSVTDYVAGIIRGAETSALCSLSLFVFVGGVGTNLGLVQVANLPDTWHTMRLVVDSTGTAALYYGLQGQVGAFPLIVGNHSALAAGGALDEGRFGIIDQNLFAIAATRSYDNFAAWAPEPDAVLYPNQSAELRTDGIFRETADGISSGPVENDGDLPRLPAAGLEGRPTELFLKASRGDFTSVPDTGIDDIGVQVFYRASFIFPTV